MSSSFKETPETELLLMPGQGCGDCLSLCRPYGNQFPIQGMEIPTVEVNVIGTINVLQASLNSGVKYFVHPPRPALAVWQTPYIISQNSPDPFYADVQHHLRPSYDRS